MNFNLPLYAWGEMCRDLLVSVEFSMATKAGEGSAARTCRPREAAAAKG